MNLPTQNLFDAIQDLSVTGVLRAIHQGADVNARAALGGLTPLHVVCWLHGKRTQQSLRLSPETETITRILLDQGADPTARDRTGGIARRLGVELCNGMPSNWAVMAGGEQPHCLRELMNKRAADNMWPEADPDKKEGNALVKAQPRVGMFVRHGVIRGGRKVNRTQAAA